ncbi:MAG: exopolysaccharide biosynthesis protein [Alphaproteobacteria bacterium]|jgi:hypothetical protein|nr:exopolysaccharide biosynthesis protein [Alphaproteobacteria bacterium]
MPFDRDVPGQKPTYKPGNLHRLVKQIAEAGDKTGVTLRDIIDTLGPRSFGPMLLVPALAIVSPASAIPTVPTLLSIAIGLIAVQIFLKHDRVWLPEFLLRKRLSARRFEQTLTFLRKLAYWLDPVINERLTVLTDRPGNYIALLICSVMPLFMPLIELMPFVTSFVACALALFAAGLLFRDGVLMLAGYVVVASGGVFVYQIADEILDWLFA